MLRHRWFFLAVVCLGVLLALPSLAVGFVADDYTFIQRLEEPGEHAAFRLYEFATGEPGQEARLLNTRWVACPWWIADGFKVRFLRPLSSGLFALDHALFGRAPLGYHVHCLVWYALLLLAVGLFLRRVCAPAVARLAFLLFALNASHAEAFAWISSRHMLVATAPALFGLVALIERRERGLRFGLPLGLLGMAFGFLGGDAALPVACYWLAYAALGGSDPADLRERLRRMALPLVWMVAYVALYKALGYGVSGSAAYLDPISSPRAFWSVLPARLAMLLAEAWTGLPANLSLTTLPGPGVAVGVVMTVGVLLLLRSIWPTLPLRERRALLWLSTGALLGLLGTAGAFLGSRLLLMPGIGGFVVIATLLRHGWHAARSKVAMVGGRALVACLALVHVGWAPLGVLLNCYLTGKVGAATGQIDASLDAHFRAHRALVPQPTRVFVLVASDPFAAFYAAAVRATRGLDATGQWGMVSLARGTHRVERTAGNELELQIEPSMLRSTFEGLFRSTDAPFVVGAQGRLKGAVVTVLAVDAGHPSKIRLTLTRGSFDDGDVCLLAWRAQRLVPVQLALHERLSIPWSPGPTGLL